MIKSRFEELVKTLKTQTTFRGTVDNAVSEASKLLEINYTTRQVDQELELCKLAIVEHMKRHEAAAATLTSLAAERSKIAISREKLSKFANDACPQMMEIEETRRAVVALLNDDDRELDEKNLRELSEAIQEVNNEREDVLAKLEAMGRSVERLETELNDITTCIKLQKTENDTLRDNLTQQRKDIVNSCYKLLARHEELSTITQNRSEGHSSIKIRKGEPL